MPDSKKLQKGLKCVECETVYPISPMNYCDECFSPVQPHYDPDKGDLRKTIEKGPRTLFRYAPLLPVNDDPGYDIGFTELHQSDELAERLGFQNGKMRLKIEEGPYSGTFKDRGVMIVASLLPYFRERFGNDGYAFEMLGGTSTGNLASSIASVGNLTKTPSVVIVHGGVDENLVRKTLSFGAYVLVVNSDYSTANNTLKGVVNGDDNLGSRIAWINMGLRPLYSQGAKTIGLEIAEQLGWNSPEHIVHPVAAGLSLWQIYAGLKEAEQFGLLDGVKTRIHAAQPEGCNPVVSSILSGKELTPFKNPHSAAETLCVSDPSNGYNTIDAVVSSGGTGISVTEDDIAEGMMIVEQTTDWNTGPVGGTTIAATKKLF